jgi:hypothetical protein
MVIERRNGIELEKMDEFVYKLYAKYIIVIDKTKLREIKKQHKKLVEEQTGLKCIHAEYALMPDLTSEFYRLLPVYYLVNKK